MQASPSWPHRRPSAPSLLRFRGRDRQKFAVGVDEPQQSSRPSTGIVDTDARATSNPLRGVPFGEVERWSTQIEPIMLPIDAKGRTKLARTIAERSSLRRAPPTFHHDCLTELGLNGANQYG